MLTISKLGKEGRIMQRMLAAHQANELIDKAVLTVKRTVRTIIERRTYRERANVAVWGNIREPHGEVVVVDCFDILFPGFDVH